ncbi:MAG TPA: hypothetical protein VGG10_08330 [Rhizomicrobium sp.]|jgi:hypothetical protein
MADWDLVLPPSRPAAWQLAHIQRYLAKLNRRIPIAVLGSTPEFRDLLAELGFQRIYVFEKNRTFYEHIGSLRCYHNRETLVEGDWLRTLSRYRGRFGAILSDLTSGNIPYEHRELFYLSVSSALAPRGCFIDKLLTHPIPHERLEVLEARYKSAPLNLATFNRFSCEFLFCSELLDLKSEVDSTLFYSLLAERFTDPRLKFILKAAQKITPKDCRWWYGRPWRGLRPSYFAYLKGVATIADVPESPYAGRGRLLFSERR